MVGLSMAVAMAMELSTYGQGFRFSLLDESHRNDSEFAIWGFDLDTAGHDVGACEFIDLPDILPPTPDLCAICSVQIMLLRFAVASVLHHL